MSARPGFRWRLGLWASTLALGMFALVTPPVAAAGLTATAGTPLSAVVADFLAPCSLYEDGCGPGNYQATVSWGDGGVEAGAVHFGQVQPCPNGVAGDTEDGGNICTEFYVYESHVYANSGSYTIEVDVANPGPFINNSGPYGIVGSSTFLTPVTVTPPIPPPTISASAVADGQPYFPGNWTNRPVTVSFNCSTAATVASLTSPTTVGAQGSGQSVVGSCTDSAGQGASTTFGPIDIDATPPVITATETTADGKVYLPGTWTNQAVTLTFACADALSGVAVCPTPLTLSTEQSGTTVTGTSVDKAGNTASVTVSGINIDLTPPVTVASTDPASNSGGWSDAPVAVSLAATDALSGVAQTQYSLDGSPWTNYAAGMPLAIGAEGRHVVQYRSIDKAGNSEAAHALDVNVDLTPPVTQDTVSGTQGGNGWFKAGSPVVLTLTATDPSLADGTSGSGVATTWYRINGARAQAYTAPVTLADGTYSIQYGSVDNAGNREQAHAIALHVDQTPPMTVATSDPGPNANGWNNTTVEVTLTAIDNLSGVNAIQYSLDGGPWSAYGGPVGIAADGVHTVRYNAQDNAGNAEAPHSLSVRVDKTAPETAVRFNPTTLALDVTGVDSGSGVAGSTLQSCLPAGPAIRRPPLPPTVADSVYGPERVEENYGPQVCTYLITDLAGNRLTVRLQTSEHGQSLDAGLVDLAYTVATGTKDFTPVNHMRFQWAFDPKSQALRMLDQQVDLGRGRGHSGAQARYDAGQAQTRLSLPDQRSGQASGLVLLVVRSHDGGLTVGS